ncbi:hypothetical protein LGN04_19365 [Burkholderia multivorans]|nr:hypothetical protein [Burkholderia multivorans]EEE00965.1 hypothetical protein BURMUCGD1_0360 [Burkholderia multivorans CGD1]EJO57109.1 hypothetical protein BURMUCF1_2901 [Burkholderia multivorans ATCC BAA-247]MBU9280986.1 hypothetical protein [Burkholderia multivorans]MBU9633245.1 hypothetical protein [Burkholderia multivorans]MCA8456090.1 hypothetical protein [Burkholderia multivorans]
MDLAVGSEGSGARRAGPAAGSAIAQDGYFIMAGLPFSDFSFFGGIP